MKATTLAISVPYYGCQKDCPYCVSKMTGYIAKNEKLFSSNMAKVRHFANLANVSNVIITGKGEPFLYPNLERVITSFEEFPVEVQTNGLFKKDGKLDYKIYACQQAGLNTVAISVDKPQDFCDTLDFISCCKKNGLNIRYTINLTDSFKDWSFYNFLDKVEELGADQFSFRNITIPNNINLEGELERKTADWIVEHKCLNIYYDMIAQVKALSSNFTIIRHLPYGATLYDVRGISFTYFDYCIQDESGEDDIRSLIYQEDGHLYTSWSSKASKIF